MFCIIQLFAEKFHTLSDTIIERTASEKTSVNQVFRYFIQREQGYLCSNPFFLFFQGREPKHGNARICKVADISKWRCNLSYSDTLVQLVVSNNYDTVLEALSKTITNTYIFLP